MNLNNLNNLHHQPKLNYVFRITLNDFKCKQNNLNKSTADRIDNELTYFECLGLYIHYVYYI
jgi:hypothetical protein